MPSHLPCILLIALPPPQAQLGSLLPASSPDPEQYAVPPFLLTLLGQTPARLPAVSSAVYQTLFLRFSLLLRLLLSPPLLHQIPLLSLVIWCHIFRKTSLFPELVYSLDIVTYD